MLATFRRCRTVKPVSQFLHHSVNMAFCARAISLRRTSGARRNVRSSRARRLKALILTASGQSRSIVPISHSIWPRRARNGATLVALRLEAERFCVIDSRWRPAASARLRARITVCRLTCNLSAMAESVIGPSSAISSDNRSKLNFMGRPRRLTV